MTVDAGHIGQDPTAILGRMEAELMASPTLAREQWPRLRGQAHTVVRRKAGALVLTGCGDSLYAGLAVRGALEQLAGVPVVAMPAMEAARFPTRLLGEDTLLIAVSVSGKVERTIEAVAEHRRRGGATLAISAFDDSDLASTAEAAIATGIRGTPGPVPGTANYLGSLLALYAVGFALAARQGEASLGSDDALSPTLSSLDAVLAAGGERAERVASRLSPPFFAIGSGPDFGSACFGVAKFVEAAATLGVAQDLEEWAHELYFITGPGRTVFLFAMAPEATDRARRVAISARKVGADVIVVGPNAAALDGEPVAWPMPPVVPMLTPLVSWAPLAMTALAYARFANRSPFGIDQPERMRTVDSDIYLSKPRRR